MMMPVYELRSVSAKRVAKVQADNLESVFIERGRLVVVTIDGKAYHADSLEYMMGKDYELPEYSI
jgi:hypothetical protein